MDIQDSALYDNRDFSVDCEGPHGSVRIERSSVVGQGNDLLVFTECGSVLTLRNSTVTSRFGVVDWDPECGGHMDIGYSALAAEAVKPSAALGAARRERMKGFAPDAWLQETTISMSHSIEVTQNGDACERDANGNLRGPAQACGLAAFNGTYFPLKPNSPAIDAADNANCPLGDQIGHSRPVDGDGDGVAVCDIGPIEYRSPPTPTPTPTPRRLWLPLFKTGAFTNREN